MMVISINTLQELSSTQYQKPRKLGGRAIRSQLSIEQPAHGHYLTNNVLPKTSVLVSGGSFIQSSFATTWRTLKTA